MESRINSPLSSGLGRLFDGVTVLLGRHRQVSFEGQEAMQLEMLATGSSNKAYPFKVLRQNGKPYILDISSMIKALVKAMEAGQDSTKIAASFHQTIIDAFAAMADEMRKKTGLTRVALSGGCFQNKILLEGIIDKLNNAGFGVYCQGQVPANDGGISPGQAVVASSMMKKGLV